MSLRSAVGAVLRGLGLHRVTVAYTERERVRSEERWRRHVLAAVDGAVRPRLVAGTIEADAVPVVMCLWNRPHRFSRIIELLESQELDRPVRLILWNNKPENGAEYRAELARRGARGAIASVEYYDSPVNLGGIARFVVVHTLVRDGYRGDFVTYDDDIEVSERFLADVLAASAPLSAAGWWAWNYGDDYWQRTPAEPGQPATYVGTGAAVFDSALVADRRFFSDLPARFGFLEDMWSSYWVTSRGGRLTKVDTEAALVDEELNQHHGFIELKAEFARYLRDRRES